MKFEYRLPETVRGIWKDSQGYLWEYGDRTGKLFGEARRKSRVTAEDVLVFENHQIAITPVSRRLRLTERLEGYLPCVVNGESGCIRIVSKSYIRVIVAIAAAVVLVASGILWAMENRQAKVQDEVIHMELPDSLHNDDPTGYTIPDYTVIDKNVHNERTDTWLINVNDNICDISYEIYIDGSSNPIYSSPVLGEGDVIKGMTLKDDLTVGDYSYTMICTLYTPGTHDVIGEQTMEGVLHVYDES